MGMKKLLVTSCFLILLALPPTAGARGDGPSFKWTFGHGSSFGSVTSGRHGVAVNDRECDGKTVSLTYHVKSHGRVRYGGVVIDTNGCAPNNCEPTGCEVGWVEIDPWDRGRRGRDYVVGAQICKAPKRTFGGCNPLRWF
jgi:hypothetical protein